MYKILINKKADKFLRKLDSKLAGKIRKKIRDLASDPYAPNQNVTRLQGCLGYRLRVGDYRVIYEIRNNVLIIEVIDIGHRKEIYK